MFKLSNLGVTPTTSLSMDETEREKEKQPDIESVMAVGDVYHADDGRHSRGLPLQLYMNYAKTQREFEDSGDADALFEEQVKQMKNDPRSNLSPEKIDAEKQLRIASFFAVIWLITTDILGPSNAGYAISTLGYGPGITLYVMLGFAAAFCGWLLNVCFVKLDSTNYALRTFADLAGRAIAPWFRYPTALLQFFQMILNVGLILLSTGQALAQMLQTLRGEAAASHPCFVIQVLVWSFLGMMLGQIKKLTNFANIANTAVWMNITVCILTMVAVAVWPDPNYKLIWANFGTDYPYNTTEINKVARLNGLPLSDRIDGMNNMVFAWGGATIFVEVMAEMRRPRDFWKGMLIAQSIIMVVYLTFGVFVYSYLGQWCYTAANQAITQPAFQTVTNIINIVSGMLAATLYGNVGLKVLYQGFLVSDFHWPELTTKKGTIIWGVLVILYWGVAFILAEAIPLVNTLTTIVGAFCILQFSYTLPPLFTIILMLREDAGKEDIYDPQTLKVTKKDSYFTSISRHKRAWTYGGPKRMWIKIFLTTFLGAALALAGLCCYSALEDAIAAYGSLGTAHVFSCSAAIG